MIRKEERWRNSKLAEESWKNVATEDGAGCSCGCRCPWKCDKRLVVCNPFLIIFRPLERREAEMFLCSGVSLEAWTCALNESEGLWMMMMMMI